MVIEIKSDIFKGADFKSINFLIQISTYKNRYTLYAELSKVKDTDMFKRLDREDQDILIASYNAEVVKQDQTNDKKKLSKSDYFVTNIPSNRPNEFNITEAIRFFIQPISVILENSLNDSYFVGTLIANFDDKGEVVRHLQNNWVQFENAGGCTNVENFLQGKLQSFNSLPKDNFHYLRCFVLLDSDRNSPAVPVNSKNLKLEKFLIDNSVSYHILEKRTMENYMPDEVFDEFRGNNCDAWIDAYLHLDDIQKDHLNISKGFPKKKDDGTAVVNRTDLSAEIQALYHSVSDINFGILNEGFKLGEFKRIFPLKYRDSFNVHKETLIMRTRNQANSGELKDIVDKIRVLL